MEERTLAFVVDHRRIVLLALVTLLLITGFAGEAAAHNPAGVAVPGCENGADVVAHSNPTCHG